jgi:hypothetical protein
MFGESGSVRDDDHDDLFLSAHAVLVPHDQCLNRTVTQACTLNRPVYTEHRAVYRAVYTEQG